MEEEIKENAKEITKEDFLLMKLSSFEALQNSLILDQSYV